MISSEQHQLRLISNGLTTSNSYHINYPDTQLIRAFGILLIINSHLDLYYPVKELATGGALGNSIFFFLSGFGIYLSQQRSTKPFSAWIATRISRIYPSIWIVLILVSLPLMIMEGRLNETSGMIFIGKFFNPPWWFLQALLIFYILSYHLLKETRRAELFITFSLFAIIYIIAYFTWVDLTKWSVEKWPFDQIHYFMVFLFGIIVAKRTKAILFNGLYNYFILIILIVLIYAHKFLMTKSILPELQFLQQIAMYPIVYYLLKVSRSPFVLTNIMRFKPISTSVDFLSNHTLEIYIVHETINHPIATLPVLFPLNIFTFMTLTFILSALVKRLADVIRQNID
ncbi:MAG: acyltransferase family protein [Syntrophobacteraceae bacterium]